MKRIFFIAILIFLFVNVALSQSATPTLLPADTLQSVFAPSQCQRGCWMGIEPGVTSRNEVESILNSLNINYISESYGHTTDPDPEAYSWIPNQNLPYIDNNNGKWKAIVYFNQDTNIASQITIPINISLSQVISEYGNPSWILYTPDGVYDLVYPHHGLSFLINNTYGSSTIIRVNLLTSQGIEQHFSVEGTATDCSFSDTVCPAPTATPAP
jgi:hypothetical protein